MQVGRVYRFHHGGVVVSGRSFARCGRPRRTSKHPASRESCWLQLGYNGVSSSCSIRTKGRKNRSACQRSASNAKLSASTTSLAKSIATATHWAVAWLVSLTITFSCVLRLPEGRLGGSCSGADASDEWSSGAANPDSAGQHRRGSIARQYRFFGGSSGARRCQLSGRRTPGPLGSDSTTTSVFAAP